MSAYLLFIRETVYDELAFSSSIGLGMRAQDSGLKPLAYYGDVRVLEGEPLHSVVLIEFPDLEAALAWYNGPEYRKAREQRAGAADYRVIAFEGRKDFQIQ